MQATKIIITALSSKYNALMKILLRRVVLHFQGFSNTFKPAHHPCQKILESSACELHNISSAFLIKVLLMKFEYFLITDGRFSECIVKNEQMKTT